MDANLLKLFLSMCRNLSVRKSCQHRPARSSFKPSLEQFTDDRTLLNATPLHAVLPPMPLTNPVTSHGALLPSITIQNQQTSLADQVIPSATFNTVTPTQSHSKLQLIVDGGPVFAMSSDLKMPVIHVHAHLTGIDPSLSSTVRFTWTTQVIYHASDSTNPNARDVIGPVLKVIAGKDYTPQFDKIRGGDLTISVSATVAGKTLTAQSSRLRIIGANPSVAQLNAYIDTHAIPGNYPKESKYDYHKILHQIASWESSGGKQFLPDGSPKWSHDKPALFGAGIMQITPASDDEIWNWKVNIDDGIRIFNAKLSDAVGYPARVAVKTHGELNAAKNRLHLTSVVIEPFGPDRIVREAIQRYNGGVLYRIARDSHGRPTITIHGSTGVATWVEGGNGYLNDVLSQPG